jgi:hypothetical protein
MAERIVLGAEIQLDVDTDILERLPDELRQRELLENGTPVVQERELTSRFATISRKKLADRVLI